MTPQTRTAPLAYETHGPVAGLPVVLVHGFPFDRHLWDAHVPFLAGAGFRVIAVDLPGFGDSPSPGRHREVPQMADDLAAVLDHAGAGRAVLVGFSMGGYVAMELADRHPDRVAGLVLVATRAEPDTPEGRRGRLDLADAVAREGMAPLKAAMMPILLPPATQRERRGLVRDVGAWFDRARPDAVVKALLALADRRDLRPRLASLKAPTLVVVGAADAVMGRPPSELLASSIPGARLEVLPACGHMLVLEEPVRFRQALRAFLEALRPVAAAPA